MKLSDAQERDLRNCEFVRLLAQHELRLAGYLHTLVPSWHDAEDILQDTKIRAWEQFESFQSGTDFAAWIFTIASYQVRTYRKKCQRQRIYFNDDLLEKLARCTPAIFSEADDRISALLECLKTLGTAGRNLLRLSCSGQQKIKTIACDLGQTPAATYKALSRIRRQLFDCVEKRLQVQQGKGEERR